MKEHVYKYELLPEKSDTALVRLGTHALGGKDAMNFTSLLNEIGKTDIKYVIADLTEIQVINSSGLGMLVSGLSTLKKYNIELVLTGLPKKVADIMLITRLDTIFKIYDTVEKASR